MEKICKKCKTEKPLEDFHKKSSGVLGVRENCKSCRSNRKPKEWDSGFRTCLSCEITKPNLEFPQNAQGNPRNVCKACKSRYENYGLNKQAIDDLLKLQNNKCGICLKRLNRFCIDHDHSCCAGIKTCGKCVRGVLCVSCNSQLGWREKYFSEIENYLQKKEN